MSYTIIHQHNLPAHYVQLSLCNYGPQITVRSEGEDLHVTLQNNGREFMLHAVKSLIMGIKWGTKESRESDKQYLAAIIKEATDTLREWEEEEAKV